jgi:hypothetical protein
LGIGQSLFTFEFAVGIDCKLPMGRQNDT